MRLAWLYLRSRLAGYALALLGLIATATGLALWASQGDLFLFGAILFALPLVAAVVIATGTHMPHGESEHSASYPLPMLRLGHLLALIVWTGWTLAGAALLSPPHTMTGLTTAGELVQPITVALWLVRNLLGFAGLCFLAARWVGSGRAWVIALVHGILTLTTGPETVAGWPLRPPGDGGALLIIGILLGVGLVAVVPKGAREDAADSVVI